MAICSIDSLMRSGAPAGDVVPTLLRRLESTDRRTSLAAMDALGRFEHEAVAAVPTLRARSGDGEPYESVVRTHTLFRITGELDDADLAHVSAALTSKFVPVQLRATQALRDFGPEAATAVPAIAKALRRTSIGVRTELCEALASIGSKDGITALVGVLRHERDEDARIHDDVVAYDDLSAAIRALVALDARSAVGDVRKIVDWDSDPDFDDARRLRRVAKEAVAKLSD